MADEWLLMTWNVPPASAGLMARLRMKPSRHKATTFWRAFDSGARDQVLAAIDLLKEAGLHGIARHKAAATTAEWRNAVARKQARQNARAPYRDSTGFGDTLNATPIRSAYRMRKRRR